MSTYRDQNEAKKSFDTVYGRETPHSYLEEMASLGYQIAEQARPYCVAAANLMCDENPGWPIQMLDVGCSYGIGAAFVKYGVTFEELASFYQSRAPRDYMACTAAMRMWLNVVAPQVDMTVVGLDVSANAVQFALDSSLIDGGISRNLEKEELTPDEEAWISGCNLLVCTGAIGYIGKPTFDRILKHLGKSRAEGSGPVALMTILRMFDKSEVQASFEAAGWAFKRIDGVRLPQRAFADEDEQEGVLQNLRRLGIDPEGWESHGVFYADLYAAAQPAMMDKLEAAVRRVAEDQQPPLFASHVAVATAKETAELTLAD